MLQAFWPGSLQARLALFCSVAILLVSLLLCGVGYLQDSARLRKLQLQHAEESVSLLAADIDERIRSRQVQLEQAAANLQPSAAEVQSQAQELIRRFRFLKGSFNSVELYSADGHIVADYPALPGRVGVDASNRDDFVRSRQLLRPGVAGPLPARGGQLRNVVMFTAPILDAHGQFAGMLGGSLELSSAEFFGELRGMSLGNSGYITLIARATRQQILHPQREQLLRVVQPAANTPLALALKGSDGSEVRDGDAEDGTLLVYRNLHNVDWLLTGVEPIQEAYAPLADIGSEYLVLLVLALLLAVPLAWRGAQRLLRPLTALQRKVRAMPAGEDAAIAVEGCDELQTLATTVADVYADRRRMADSLAMREAMFRALHDTSPLGVFVCDAEGVLSYGNRAMLALAGMERSSAYWFGRRWLEAVHSSDYQQLQADWRQWSRDASGEFRRQFRLNHVRHEPLLVALRCSRMVGEGAPRFLAVIEDISEREETRCALLAERERLQGVLQGVGDAVILTGQHDEVLQLNMPARQLLGVKLEEAQGRSLSLFVTLNLPESGQPLSLGMLAGLHQEQTLALDLLGRDMRRLPVLLTLSVVAAPGSMHGYKVWLLREDSARRRLLSLPGEAERDSSTGLLNRRGMLAALAGLLADDQVASHPHSVVWLELRQDGVPLDNAAQQGGDPLLPQVAAILQRRLRSSDCIAYLEGGAFTLLLYRCHGEHAERILQNVCDEIARLHPATADSSALTTCVGITELQAGDAVGQEVLQRAERRSRQSRQLASGK